MWSPQATWLDFFSIVFFFPIPTGLYMEKIKPTLKPSSITTTNDKPRIDHHKYHKQPHKIQPSNTLTTQKPNPPTFMHRKPKTKPKPTNIANPTQIRAFIGGIRIGRSEIIEDINEFIFFFFVIVKDFKW